jgi:hypothetical protein
MLLDRRSATHMEPAPCATSPPFLHVIHVDFSRLFMGLCYEMTLYRFHPGHAQGLSMHLLHCGRCFGGTEGDSGYSDCPLVAPSVAQCAQWSPV